MPKYVYRCDRCRRTQEQGRPVDSRDTPYECQLLITDDIYCNGTLVREPTAANFKIRGGV